MNTRFRSCIRCLPFGDGNFADLVLPDTTYLERYDTISLLDRPISTAHGPADAIRQPVVQPDRDVRPWQEVLIELGARLGLPAFTKEDGSAAFPGGYPDYMVNHERTPGIGPLAGWRGADGNQHGKGDPNPNQLESYIENGCFWQLLICPNHSSTTNTPTRTTWNLRTGWALFRMPSRS